MELSKLRILVALLLCLNILSGFFMHYQANGNGYTVIHLILIYMLGGYLRREDFSLSSCLCIGGYVLIALINAGLCWLLISHSDVNGMLLCNYNNPLVIAESVLVFLVFKNLKLQSNAVNKIAKSVVAVLLIQDIVLREIMANNLKSCIADGAFCFLYTAGTWFILFFILAYIVEMARIPLADKIIKFVVKYLPKKLAEVQI